MAGSGGAWKVAYADFVTAMMAFFLVMWIVAQNKPVREAVAQYFRDPSGGNTILPGKSNSLIPLKDGGPSPLNLNPLNKGRGPGQVNNGDPNAPEVRTSGRTNRISLEADKNSTVGTQVLFADDATDLDDAARAVLDEITPTLLGKANKIELRGHANGRRTASEPSHGDVWELSFARAVATMKYMADKGIDPRRIRLSQSGANDPFLVEDVVNGNARNARVEIYVLNEIITGPADAEDRRPGKPKKPGPKRPMRPKATVDVE